MADRRRLKRAEAGLFLSGLRRGAFARGETSNSGPDRFCRLASVPLEK